MRIRIAEEAGFCFGVQRALDIINRAKSEGKKLSTLGPIIHNPQVVEGLAREGIESVDDLSEARTPYVVVRSHGVPPEIYEEAKSRGIEIIDATCPFVKTAQDVAKLLASDGYQVVVVGKEYHPEVLGLVGHAGGKAIVVDEPSALKGLVFSRKVGVLAQTTMRYEIFAEVVSELLRKAREVRAFNTICYTTRRRQESTRELARQVDLMIVVGGRNSSNTTRLYEICEDMGVPTHLIESPDEIDPKWLESVNEVGITAGASTPPEVVEEVVERLQAIGRVKEGIT
ncbi:MAG: 4-hydroxy-3-methylbut-2-enyl diphosphate reductase [candidate division WOR-3 bacterium]